MSMKVVQYAFEYSYTWADNFRSGCWDIVHGESRDKARWNAYNKSDWDDIRALFDIRLRRRPELDFVENIRHPLVDTLTDKQQEDMLHAIGKDISREPYRNKYVIDHSDSWDDLVTKGLAVKNKAIGMNYYYLTTLGIQVIQSTLPTTRHNLNNQTK